MREIQVGDRVHVKINEAHMKVDGEGVIVHIWSEALFVHEYCPIQIELDSPYDDSEQIMVRASLKEVRPI
jgi:hypothetical protein